MMKEKDWKNSKSIQVLGASNHSDNVRDINDYYATEPKAVRLLLEKETFSNNIWECCCGEKHLSNEMERLGHNVYSTDLIDRGNIVLDFLSEENNRKFKGDIITNPPYKYANEFILKGLSLLKEGNKIALFLPIRYLEGKARKKIYESTPPKTIYVSSGRLACAMNADFENMTGSAVSYMWIIWEKGFTGTTELKWFN